MPTGAPLYEISRLSNVPPVNCPCGKARRVFAESSGGVASMHLVDIQASSEVHYHRKTTEFYYVLAGKGTIELDGQTHAIEQGDAILIRPGCRHRAVGDLQILNVPVPSFDPDDEWVVGTG